MENFQAKLGSDGRIIIPVALRKALNITAGEDLILEVKNGELHAYTRQHAVRRARALMQQHVKNRNLVDELIAERRQDAQREFGKE